MSGRVLGDYAALQALPNVHFLGFKPYTELPRYGKHFDLAFMSWPRPPTMSAVRRASTVGNAERAASLNSF